MGRLAVIVGGCIFIAAGIIVVFTNWQGALFLLAIGVGLLLFAFKG